MKHTDTTAQLHIERRDLLSLAVLGGGCLLIILLITRGRFLYGSTVDWVNQHSVLPEYFRSRFYETGNLLPEFAPHIGGGQNIFHFSYYGFLSPVMLLSWLLPGVAMTDYVAVSSVILLILSGWLFYYWLRRKGYGIPAAFTAAFLFQFSAPLLYHSHKQIMFMNYMPFLLMALIGVDRYFERRRSGLLMTGAFLMIMTSYFYSVGGLLVLLLYGIDSWLGLEHGRLSVRHFFKDGIRFVLRLLIPAAMAALLLLPTLAALLNGRSADSADMDLPTLLTLLLFPKVSLENVLYSPYGAGVTAVSILALIRMIWKGGSRTAGRPGRFLAVSMAVIFVWPLFLYLLNGGLYLRGKVFIPFLPVLLLITADMLEELAAPGEHGYAASKSPDVNARSAAAHPVHRLSRRRILLLILLLALLFALDGGPIGLAFLADGVLTVFCMKAAVRRQSFRCIALPAALLCFGICIGVNLSDTLVPKETADEMYAPEKRELLEWISDTDPDYYRVNQLTNIHESCNLAFVPGIYLTSLYSSCYSPEYNLFHSEIMAGANNATNSIARLDSGNLLFQTFMGVRYLIADNPDPQSPGASGVPSGYQKIRENGSYALYRNDSVFPVAYGSSHLMGQEEYESLADIDRSIAHLQYIIVDDAPETGYRSPVTELPFFLPLEETQSGNAYRAESEGDLTVSIDTGVSLDENLLLLEFYFRDVPDEDIVILANGTANRLTGKDALYPNQNFAFHYVISEPEPTKTLTLTFSAGTYELLNPKLYSLDASVVRESADRLVPLTCLRPDDSETVLSGVITMPEDGYFTASIPYDRGFTAYVDGEERPIELVNTAFLGFPLEKGDHEITLVYHAPMLEAGKRISAAGALFFLLILSLERLPQPMRNLQKRIRYKRKEHERCLKR